MITKSHGRFYNNQVLHGGMNEKFCTGMVMTGVSLQKDAKISCIFSDNVKYSPSCHPNTGTISYPDFNFQYNWVAKRDWLIFFSYNLTFCESFKA